MVAANRIIRRSDIAVGPNGGTRQAFAATASYQTQTPPPLPPQACSARPRNQMIDRQKQQEPSDD